MTTQTAPHATTFSHSEESHGFPRRVGREPRHFLAKGTASSFLRRPRKPDVLPVSPNERSYPRAVRAIQKDIRSKSRQGKNILKKERTLLYLTRIISLCSTHIKLQFSLKIDVSLPNKEKEKSGGQYKIVCKIQESHSNKRLVQDLWLAAHVQKERANVWHTNRRESSTTKHLVIGRNI